MQVKNTYFVYFLLFFLHDLLYNDLMNDFYARIDELLKERKLTQKDLCQGIGLASNQIYTNWKSRDSMPAADVAFKIAQYLNTTVEYLLTGSESNILAQQNETLKDTLNKIHELSKV